MATPPKKPTDGTKPPAPRKPATPRKTPRKAGASAAAKPGRKAPAAETSAPAPAQAETTTASAAPAKPAAKPSTRKPAAKRAATPVKTAGTGTGRRWGIAAAIGGVGAALTAGVLALRSSTPRADEDVATPNKGEKAHQADGTDSSASFEAGIADEGTIPE